MGTATLAQVSEAVYATVNPKWWHTEGQRAAFEQIVNDALESGILEDCMDCSGNGCKACSYRGLVMPGLNW